MFTKLKCSLLKINYRLYISLLVMGFVPTIYNTVRVFFLGELPSEWSFSIAGQLAWVNLLYEIINEAIILPLFYFMGKVKGEREKFSNRVRTGMLIIFCLYVVLSMLVIIFTEPLLKLMATDITIINETITYIRIESVANIFLILMQFTLVVLTTLNKNKYLYMLTGMRLVMCILLDVFLVSEMSMSLKLGINGIGYSNIIVNVILLVLSIVFMRRENIKVLSTEKLSFIWCREFIGIGVVSGIESLVRNVAYMVMISRMINIVSEQGTYWVANNFIWGWLLLPIIQLGELVKQEVAADKENVRRNTLGYFGITIIVLVTWFAGMPIWKLFMKYVIGFSNVDKLFEIVLILVISYIFYAFQNIFDATFYGLGKTNYMLFESVVTNTVYYGVAFVLYITNLWTPTLIGIVILFGIGNAFDSAVSFGAYRYLLKKEKINILDVK